MKTRIITSVVALAVFIGVLLAPPMFFTIALAAVIFIMLYECYSATKSDFLMKFVGFISAVLLMVAIALSSGFVREDGFNRIFFIPAVVAVIMLHMALVIAKHGKKDYKTILANGFLTMYIVISASCIWISKEKFGISNMLLIFICAWMTDTCAYFTGRALGKRKLIPHVSPNKTVAGAVGGVIGAVISCILYLFITNNLMNISTVWSNIYIEGALIGLAGGVLSQLGDLTASAIKRDTEIKDFGWIFPGHGGFMDRFDSVIFIAPVICGIIYIISAAV